MKQIIEQKRREYREYYGHTIDIIIQQYRIAANALNELFALAPDTCYEKDGIGCCRETGIPVVASLMGPATDELLYLQLRVENTSKPGVCYFHSEGCLLGDLKPPICLSHYCEGILTRTSYDRLEVTHKLQQILCPQLEDNTLHSDYYKILDSFLTEIEHWKQEVKDLND